MTRVLYPALACSLAVFALSCANSKPISGPHTAGGLKMAGERTEKVSLAQVGLSASALDRSVKPCDDFYQFACGGWIKKTQIPGDKPRWVRSFSEIHKRNESELRGILEGASKSKDAQVKRLGQFYDACMNETSANEAGVAPLKPLLKLAGKLRRKKDITPLLAKLHQHRIWAIFSLSSEQDFKDSTQVIGELDQAGLGLPDRDYYLKEDDRSKKLRGFYVGHVERMLALSGYSAKKAKSAAKAIMALETSLAKHSLTRVERRDPAKVYHKIDRAGVEAAAKAINWTNYFKAIGHPDIKPINVTSVKFLEGANALIGKVPVKTWRSYFHWHIVRSLSRYLSKPIVDEAFKMTQQLTGQKEQRPRWKRCIAAADSAMGELLAQPFVQRRFSAESKKSTRGMVLAISKAFRKLVATLSWMDAKTRKRALVKLDKMAYLIGYPDKWRAYNFNVGPSYAANVLAARGFEFNRRMSKIGKPVDRNEWEMSPPTVNAYYHPLRNQMVFPAGILQPPFYSAKASTPVNMGAMGMVVGHELTHGFDDQGSKFDADGNLKNWWEPSVKQSFQKKTQCVVKQYAGYDAVPGVKLNGKLTLGENIADMGGVKLAFRAYRMLRANAKVHKVAEGFTEDQQFFLSTAQIWCSKYREAYARMAAKVDPHSPPKYRVNGSLSNLPEFAKAFSCSPGSKMAPKQRCEAW